MKKFFKVIQKAGDKNLKPARNNLALVIRTAVEAKSKNRQVGQAATLFENQFPEAGYQTQPIRNRALD